MGNQGKKIYYWVACTKDEYELPVFVADTCIALGIWLGMLPSSVVNSANNKTCAKNYKIVKVLRE